MSIEEIPFKNNDDFLHYLDPANSIFETWCFRGHSDATYDLTPSVWRKSNVSLLKNFRGKAKNRIKGIKKYASENQQILNECMIDTKIFQMWLLHICFENYLLSSFYHVANKTGIEIPKRQRNLCSSYPPNYWLNDSFSWRNIVSDIRNIKEPPSSWASGCLIFEADLPQHYGLPTRWLDWTSNPRKAAFFACFSYEKNRPKDIAVYAIQRNYNDPFIEFYQNHYRYHNKFLHYQDGLFTGIFADTQYLKTGKWPSIEEISINNYNLNNPLKKIILPAEYKDDLLKGLNNCGISLSTMMPDYNHVSREIILSLSK